MSETLLMKTPKYTLDWGGLFSQGPKRKRIVGYDSQTSLDERALQIWDNARLLVQQLLIYSIFVPLEQNILKISADHARTGYFSDSGRKQEKCVRHVAMKPKLVSVLALASAWMAGLANAQTGIIAEIGNLDVGSCPTAGTTFDSYKNDGVGQGETWQTKLLVTGYTSSKSLLTGNPTATGCLPTAVGFVRQYLYTGVPGTDAVLQFERFLTEIYWWGGNQAYLYRPNTGKYEMTDVRTNTDNGLDFVLISKLYWHTNGGYYGNIMMQMSSTTFQIKLATLLQYSTSYFNRVHPIQEGIGFAKVPGQTTQYQLGMCQHPNDPYDWTYHQWNILYMNTAASTIQETEQRYYSPTNTNRGCTFYHATPRFHLMAFKWGYSTLIFEYRPLTNNRQTWLVRPTESYNGYSIQPRRIVQDQSSYNSGNLNLEIRWMIGEPTTDYTGYTIKNIDSTWYGRVWIWRWSPTYATGVHMIQGFMIDLCVGGNTFLNSYWGEVLALEVHDPDMIVAHMTISSSAANLGKIGSQLNKIVSFQLERSYEQVSTTGNLHYYKVASLPSTMTFPGGYINENWYPDHQISAVGGRKKYAKAWGSSCYSTAATPPCAVVGIESYYGWTEDIIYMATTAKKYLPTSDTTFSEGMMDASTLSGAGSTVNTNAGANSILIASSRKHTAKRDQFSAKIWNSGLLELTTNTLGHRKYGLWCSCDLSYDNNQYGDFYQWDPNSNSWGNHDLHNNIAFKSETDFGQYTTYLTTLSGLNSAYWMQWPNNTVPKTQLINSLVVDYSSGNWYNYYSPGSNINNHGHLPVYRFAVKTPTGYYSQGWYDHSVREFRFDPPIDQNAIMAARVTEYQIVGGNTHGNTWYFMSRFCISSGVLWKQPELAACMGVADSVVEDALNKAISPNANDQTFNNVAGSIIANTAPDIATFECGSTESFSSPSSLTAINTDVINMPMTYTQSQLATNGNWVNSVQKVNVVLLDSNHEFYTEVPWNSTTQRFEVNNKINELNRVRDSEQMYLLVYQRTCAKIQATPTSSWVNLALSSLNLMADEISISVTISDCKSVTLKATKPLEKKLAYPNVGGALNWGSVQNNFVSGDPTRCPFDLAWYEQYDSVTQQYVLYSANGATTMDNWIGTGWGHRQATDPPHTVGYTKRLWVTTKNKAGVTARYEVIMKMCGLEVTATPVTIPIEYKYYLGYNSGSVNAGSVMTNLQITSTDDDVDCPFNNAYIEIDTPSAGTLYSANNDNTKNVYVNSANNLIVKTSVTYLYSPLYVTAITKGNVKQRYPINVKICGSETLGLVSTTPNPLKKVYVKNEGYLNLVNLGSIVGLYTNSDGVDCPITSYNVYTSGGSLFSAQNDATKKVYVNNNNELIVQTGLGAFNSYSGASSLRIMAWSSGLRSTYFQFDVKVCGLETPVVLASSLSFGPYAAQETSAGESAGVIKTSPSVDNFFTDPDPIDCPIVDYFIEKGATPGSLYSANGDSNNDVFVTSSPYDLKIMTILPWAPFTKTDLYLTTVTKGGTKVRIPLWIKVCGAESITVTALSAPYPYYVYMKGIGLVTNFDVDTVMTSTDAQCPVLQKYIEVETVGIVYSANNDISRDMYLDTNGILRINTAAAFDKYIWPTVVTKGLVKNRVKIRVKICGLETVNSSITVAPKYIYAKDYNSGSVNEGSISTNFWNSDNADCPMNMYIENSDGTTYSTNNQVSAQFYINSLFQLVIKTNVPFGNTLYVTAVTPGQVKARYPIYIKICGSETVNHIFPAGTPNINFGVYGKDEDSGLKQVINIASHFSTTDNIECPVNAWWITYNNAGPTLYSTQGDSTKNVYIDSSLNLSVKTTVPATYNVLRLYSMSIGKQMAYYTFYLRVCGQEAPQTPAARPDQIRWYTDFTPALGAGLFEAQTGVQTFFTPDVECPFVDFFLEIGATPGTLYSANGDLTKDVYLTAGLTPNLIQHTVSPWAPYDKVLYITTVTKGKVKSRIQIRVKVCGAEQIVYLTTGVPTYIYGPGDTAGSFLASPGDMDVLYMRTNDNVECPITEKYIEQETDGVVYSAQNDATKDIYVDPSGIVRIKTTTAGMDKFVWVTGNSKGDVKGRQKIRVKVCGAESLTALIPLQPTYVLPQKIFNYNEQGGNGFYLSVAPSLSPLNEVFINTDQTECPILTYQIETAAGTLYTSMNSATGDVYATNAGKIYARTSPAYAPYDKKVWITAITKGLIKARYEVRIKVCGAEVITQTAVPTTFIYQRYQSANTMIGLKQFAISNDFECPITYWSLHEFVGGVYKQIQDKNMQVVQYNNENLSIKTEKPYEYTVYIKCGSATPPTITTSRVYVMLRIKVCGYEELKTIMSPDPSFFFKLWSGVQVMADVKMWFQNNDTECPTEKYELMVDQVKPYEGKVVVLDSSSSLYTITQQTINQGFFIKATTKGQVVAYQRFTIQMCGGEMLSLRNSSIIQTKDRNASSNLFVSLSKLDEYFINSNSKECPITSYSLQYLDLKGTYQPYSSGNLLWDPASKEIKYHISASYREEFFIKATSIGGVSVFLPIDILICGNEKIMYKTQNQANLAFVISYGQFTGSERNTQIVAKERYMSLVKSNSIRCQINDQLSKLVYDDYSTSPPVLNIEYTNTSRIKFDVNTGDFQVNTFEPFNETLKIMVRTNSSDPFFIPMNLSVAKKPAPLNRKPYFYEPGPDILDVVINETKEIYQYEFDVSKVYDDFNEIKWLNISNSALGVLKYKYDLGSQTPNFQNADSNSEHCSYSVSTYKLTCRFNGIKEVMKFVGVIYRITAWVEDYQGLYSSKVMSLNLTLDYNWYYPKKKGDDIPRTQLKEKTVAKIKRISVFGEVDIEFNKSSSYMPKNFTTKQYDYLKSKIHLYIKPADDWTKDILASPSLNFTFDIKEFTETNLRIKLNFNDPEAVSPKTKYDKLVIYIDDVSSLFDRVIGRRMLGESVYSLYLEQPIQKQMPDNPDERQLVNSLYYLRSLLTAMLLTSCALAFWYRAPLDRIIQLLVELQVLCNFALLHVTLPGNVEISGTVFKPFVSLNFFKTLVNFEYAGKQDEVDDNQKDLEYLGQRSVFNYDTFNVMFNLKSIGFIFCLWLIKVVLMALLYGYFKCADMKENTKISMMKSYIKVNRESWLIRTVFQDFLTLFLIGFMEFGIACLLTLTAPTRRFQFSWNIILAILIGASLLLGLPLVYLTLYREQNRDKADEKLGMLQLGSQSKVRNGKKLHFQYLMIFFGIRYSFLLTSFFVNRGVIQIMILLQVFGAGTCMFAEVRPFSGRWNNRLGLFNLSILVLCSYHLIAFTDYVEREAQFIMGKSFLIFILIMIIVNLLYFSKELMLVVHHFFYSNVSEATMQKIEACHLYLKYYLKLTFYYLCSLPVFKIRRLRNKSTPPPEKPRSPYWKPPRITLPDNIRVPVVTRSGLLNALYFNYKGVFDQDIALKQSQGHNNEDSFEWLEISVDEEEEHLEEERAALEESGTVDHEKGIEEIPTRVLKKPSVKPKKLESIREERESEQSQASVRNDEEREEAGSRTHTNMIISNFVSIERFRTALKKQQTPQDQQLAEHNQAEKDKPKVVQQILEQQSATAFTFNAQDLQQTIPDVDSSDDENQISKSQSPTKTESDFKIFHTGNKLFDDPLNNNEPSVKGVDFIAENNSVDTRYETKKEAQNQNTPTKLVKPVKQAKKVKKTKKVKVHKKDLLTWDELAELGLADQYEVKDLALYHDPALWKEKNKETITKEDGKQEVVEKNPLLYGESAHAWKALSNHLKEQL